MNEKETTIPEDGTVTEETLPDDMPNDYNFLDKFLSNPDVLSYIDKAIQDGIQKVLKGNTPKANTKEPAEQEFKKFEKMTYKERLNLFKTNPQAYYKLTKGV